MPLFRALFFSIVVSFCLTYNGLRAEQIVLCQVISFTNIRLYVRLSFIRPLRRSEQNLQLDFTHSHSRHLYRRCRLNSQ